MCGNPVAKVRRVPSSLAFVGLLIAAVCIVSAGCSGPKSEGYKAAATDVMPLAARVDRLDGEVGIDRQNDTQDNSQDQSSTDWGKASVNTPVSVGSRVYVKDKSHAGIAFSGRNYARLNPQTSLDVLSLSQRRTQLALRDGSGIFDVGALAPGELFEVATPNGAVDFQEPGLYQVGIDDRGSTLVSVLSGIAQVVGLAGSGQVGRGQLLTFSNDEAFLSQLDSQVCGHITDDYYSYRYPDTYDGRYSDYQTYQDDPYYDDPYRRSASYQYIPDNSDVAGLDDLDDYGDWEDVSGQGRCWHPRVSSDWAPYRDGSWYDDQPLGLTWVSNERWGWAPYHYGRWVSVGERWYWVPGEMVSRPVYAPALVAFVPFTQDDRVGWVPLGPGDPYVSRYYDWNYQPQYLGSRAYIDENVNVTNIVNYNVPGAVTVVRTTEFTRVITPGSALAADRAFLARSRPVVDPYTVPGLRELAPKFRAHGSRVQVPETANQALNRDVVISQAPIKPAVAAVKALKIKSVSEAEGNRKLQMKNSGHTVTAVQRNGLPASMAAQRGQNQTMTAQERQARLAALTAQAAAGDKSGKREMRQLQDQQRVQEKVDRRATAQAAATAQQQQQQQLKAERKQAKQQTQQSAVTQQQKQQQKAERRAAQQQNQQPAVPQQRQKQQQKAERKAAQQQNQQLPVAEQQQQKAERKAAQQQNQQLAVAEQQQKQQQKAEGKAAQQQQPPAQTSPSKADRKAAKNKNRNNNANPNQ